MTASSIDIYQPVVEEKGFSRMQPSTTEESTSKLRILSVLESSGNENNQGRLASSSSRSTTATVPSLQRRDSKSSVCSSSHHSSKAESSKEEDVLIEEKRKRANGEGYTIHQYMRGRLLGKGGFAKVYLCTALDTNKHYAVKVVPKANLVKARARQKLQAEIKIHRMLKHRHICEYKHFFEDRTNCYILLELCHNQSMNEMIKRRKRLTEPEAAFFMAQLLEAVRYMHDENVIHRDLKLGNLFLDKNVHIKVGDFGLATKVEDKEEKRKTICGTPNYIAPEVIQGDKTKRGHSFEVDIWSMGVILYTILVGKPPYEAKDVKATYQRILNNEYSFPSTVELSGNAKKLIIAMLQSNPADRPSLDEIAAHPFLSYTMIPSSIPTSALHLTPDWHVNDRGELEVVQDQLTTSRSSSSVSKAPSLPRSSRQPFGYRDPNSKSIAMSASSISKASDRQNVDMKRIVQTALALSVAAPSNSAKPAAVASPGFRIYDESGGVAPYANRVSKSRSSPPLTEETLVRRTKAMSIGKHESTPRNSSNMSVASSAFSATSSLVGSVAAGDADALLRMAERLQTVLEITQCRKGMYISQPPRPVSSMHGPSKWVTRYVDYTSKYGLGFLLNDGSSGVYFNDSTKTALEADGETFQYVERKKSDDVDSSPRCPEPSVETYSLHVYPESLKKKVTLLKHFRNYLLEQEKTEGDDELMGKGHAHDTVLVYVKKWVRTKHAILFRLSNQTVQVVFYDQTEILMTPDDRYITFVDKNRRRSTYHFNDELVGSIPEMEKRLKYTKEILHQLIAGRR